MEESHSLGCGICLLDDGKSIRGEIDSCDHYFCFVCIMEWAKIESRCPMCKRRFTTIRRPPKDGVFPCERIVIVPQRDQIYRLNGNATIGPSDPYANVQCSVCHSTTDENFLLLCDLCDLASHTYCAGLGFTVPEGDWFCHDCNVLRAEHDNAEIDIETVSDGGSQSGVENTGLEHNEETVSEKVNADGGQRIVENSGPECNNSDILEAMPPTDVNVSIYDIVHEQSDTSINLPRNSFTSYWFSHPVVPRSEIIVLDNATSLSGRPDQNTVGNSTDLNARTLQRCRDVRSRIQALRENWSALQSKSLSFSSISGDSGAKRRKRHNVSEVLHDRSGELCSSSSGSGQLLRNQNDSSRDSHDIEKAWKMMKTAKSGLQKSERASRVHQSSKNRSVKGNASKQASNTSSSLHIVQRQQPENSALRMEKQCEYYSHQSETENHRSLLSDCRDQIRVMMVKSCERLQSTDSLTESPPYGESQIQCDVYNINGARLLGKNVCETSSSVAHEQGSSCSINSTRSVPEMSYSHLGKLDACKPHVCASSSSNVSNLAESKAKKDNHAKSEIQSLVKLNLKILSRDKRLGYDAFKKVARLATHTIMAACGLEHPKSGIHFFPRSTVCNHSVDIQQLRKSTLMPNSCRECFYAFVKDVVRSIMLEKIHHGRIC